MSIGSDYHVHTQYSADGEASPEAMCEAALARGLREICFTEHVDWLPWDPTRDHFQAEHYVPAAIRCREHFAGRLEVRIGLEISEPHLAAERIQQLLGRWPFDFVLGSAHWIDQQGIFMSDLYDIHPIEHIEREYFLRVLELAQQGDFDSLGHLDLVRRYRPKAYGPFQVEDHAEIIHAILETLIARDKAFEINTSPLRRGCDATCPNLAVLHWYRALGGEKITVGSDSHRTEHMGTGFDVAEAMLRAAGFSRILVYRQREPQWVAL